MLTLEEIVAVLDEHELTHQPRGSYLLEVDGGQVLIALWWGKTKWVDLRSDTVRRVRGLDHLDTLAREAKKAVKN